MTRVVLGIPARMGSTRFPGKVLAPIWGKTMLEHVVRRSMLCPDVDDVFVACCDQGVQVEAERIGVKAVLTDPEISRPGLRVFEGARQEYELDDADILVIVQGDEPLTHPDMITAAITPMLNDNDIQIVNLCARLSRDEYEDPNEIKVVIGRNMDALYMSRAPIPNTHHEEKPSIKYKQVCVMPIRWKIAKRLNDELDPGPLELQESIEMLRAIENNIPVRMVLTEFKNKSVDTPADIIEVERLMKVDEVYLKYGY